MRKTWLAEPSFKDKEGACDLTAKNFINHIEGRRWITFTVLTLSVYFFIYGTSTLFHWERDVKTVSKHYYDVLYLILLGSFLFTFGNFNNTLSYWFILGTILGAFTIAAIGQIPGFQFSTGSLSSLSGIPLFTVAFFGLLFSTGLYFTFRYYQKCGLTTMFWTFLLVPIAILALGYWFAKIDSATVEFHLHHWQWAILFVFFARFPGVPWQSFLTGVFVGIIVDGISRYGPDTLFPPV